MSRIWRNKELSLKEINALSENTMVSALGIEFTEIGDDFLKGSMPVDHRTCQPYGILHGGASATLIETLGSIASALVVDTARQYCVGISLNVSHLSSAFSGLVTGVVKPLHLGRTTQVWEGKIENEEGKLIAAGRLTVAVLDKEKMSDKGQKYRRA